MIRYPEKEITTIGVTAPSSGVETELHELIKTSAQRQEERGFTVVIGETVWTQHHAKSAPAQKRASELMAMFQDEAIHMIMPPWGGELLIEILEYLKFDEITPKWVLGYSDLSALLLPITLKTGIATAYGTNFVDIRGSEMDETTARWKDVLATKKGESVTQASSSFYQREWDHENPTSEVFHLTEKTEWKTESGKPESFSGRLLGGCIDIVRHLAGTPYGDVNAFRHSRIPGESVIWYFENCELSATDLKRSLVQLKYAGWFNNCSGILFGRSPANQPVKDYTIEVLYRELKEELGVPVIYDIDCGHVPPQLTLINGAFAEVDVKNGEGTIRQTFR